MSSSHLLLIHPKHEETPIVMVRAEPNAVSNMSAGLLIIVAILMPACLFSIIKADGYFNEARDLRKALAEAVAKPGSNLIDANGTPILHVVKTSTIKYDARIDTDYPPVKIPELFIRRVDRASRLR